MSELYNKEMLVGTFLDLCPFGTTVTAESGTDTVDEHFKPAKDSDAWMIANEVIDYKITPTTEDDARTVFSRDTTSYVTRKNTKVTGNTIEINSTEVNPVCWQVIYQCDRLEAGKEVQPFSRNIYGQRYGRASPNTRKTKRNDGPGSRGAAQGGNPHGKQQADHAEIDA